MKTCITHFSKFDSSGLPARFAMQTWKTGFFLLAFLSVLFLTQGQSVQLGDGTGKTSIFPVYTRSSYSFTQSIYTASEMSDAGASAGTITKIRFKPGVSIPTTNWRNWTVYLTHTDKTGFLIADKNIVLSGSMIVFNGKIQERISAGQWIELTLDKPFEWNGTQNILLSVHEHTPDKSPTLANWDGYSTVPSPGMQPSVYYTHDIINPDPTRQMPVQRNAMKAQLQLQFDVACAGAPSAGIVPSQITNCAPFVLTAEGASEGTGITGQWESSPEGSQDWTIVPGATLPASTLQSAPTVPTRYRYRVTCQASGATAVSDIVETIIKPIADCYCEIENVPTSVSGSSPYFFTSGALQNVHTVEEPNSKSRYTNYTAYTISQYAGDSVKFVTALSSNDRFAIWIDWNRDGHFNDEDELVYFSGAVPAGNPEASFKVPSNVSPGLTRMRIGKIWNVQYVEPCQPSQGTGFYEDYTFEVVPRTACTGQPYAGIASESMGVKKASSFTLQVSGQTAGVGYGLSGQWESKAHGDTHWTPLEGATGTAFRVQSAPKKATDYRYILTCAESGLSDTSNITSVTLDTYTYEEVNIPTNNPTGVFIKRFTTSGGLTNINNHSGYEGHGIYTSLAVSQKMGEVVSYEILISRAWRGTVTVAVDWNQDGNFVNEGIVPTQIIGDSLYKGSFYVPHFAHPGSTRMRISYRNNNSFLGGMESEDYSFAVIPKDCSDLSFPGSVDAVASTNVLYDGGEVNVNVSTHLSATEGLMFQWQSSPDGQTWSDLGAPQTVAPKKILDQKSTTWYRTLIYCNGSLQLTSNPVTITVEPSKKIAQTTDGERCTPGSVTLTAYGDPGTVVHWYDSPTSSVPVFTGNEFTTPALNKSKTYYAAVEMAGEATGKKTVGDGKYSTYAIRSSNGPGFNPFEFSGHTPFKTFFASKYQYLVRAEEMIAAGIKPGNIHSLAFHVTNATAAVFPNYTIGLKHTDRDAFVNGRLDSNVINVFTGDIKLHPGENTFRFHTPFEWDGVSNLVISICNREQTNGHSAEGGDVEYDMLPYIATGEAGHGFWAPIICEQTNHYSNGQLRYRPKITFEAGVPAEGPRVPVNARIDAYAPYAVTNSGKNIEQTPNVVHQYVNDQCEKLADILSTNHLGNVEVNVLVGQTPVTADGIPFVSRFYTVTPSQNTQTPSILTLYFKQSEIEDYNNAVKNLSDPRFGQIDLQNPRSIRIYGYHGNINVGGNGPNGFDTTGVMIFHPTEVVVENGSIAITFTTFGFSGFFINGTLAGPLAIALGDIRASNSGNVNIVTWNTLLEEKGDIFEIEKSVNGSRFEVIGRVAAFGSASSYSFTDENPAVGYSYYRLALVSRDGTGKTYSKVVQARRGAENTFRMIAYPNPATDKTTVQISGDIGTNASLSITDLSGKRMKTIKVVSGETPVSVQSLLPGVYFIQYQDDVQRHTLKIIKI